ncbi:unnamed protein product [Arctogadus glacialis]
MKGGRASAAVFGDEERRGGRKTTAGEEEPSDGSHPCSFLFAFRANGVIVSPSWRSPAGRRRRRGVTPVAWSRSARRFTAALQADEADGGAIDRLAEALAPCSAGTHTVSAAPEKHP